MKRQFYLGTTKDGIKNIGLDTQYIIPTARTEQPSIMHKNHNVIINNNQKATQILLRVPYNLLVYPSLKIWYAHSPKGRIFMKDTTIEELYELYKFDSFVKGKILEVLRSFENMFLGALSYHFENEYYAVWRKFNDTRKKHVKAHNAGYISSSKNEYCIIPLWEQFFSEKSLVTINDEIIFWKSLSRQKFLATNKKVGPNIYKDKLNAKRFDAREIVYMHQNFKSTSVRNKCITDVMNFSSTTQQKWKREIGASEFEYLLNIIREFRNSASHPGYILNKTAHWGSSSSTHHKKYTNSDITLKDFIQIFPYFLPQDLIDSFTLSIKQILLSMNANAKVKIPQIERIEDTTGISIIN